jgi:hypothetical protein
MRKQPALPALTAVALLAFAALGGCGSEEPGEAGKVLDEARQAGRTVESFPAADEDYFADMDGGAPLSPEEVKGRNTWIVWTAGNDRLWDRLTARSFGGLDFLKSISSHSKLKFGRDTRWSYLGLVNEPCFEKATGPDPERFGLWLDKRRDDCPADPFANAEKYPGVKIGARGKNMPVGSFYGEPTGVIGLRLFPNPDFDEEAQKKWDPVRYYEDPSYYLSKDLVKPYRIGMSCGFCHVGPNPLKPPADPENPQWENLSSNVGAQYFWVDRIFDWAADDSSFVHQLFKTSRPGALDTSLISSDNINNPRTMNAVYGLAPRLEIAKRFGKETLAGGGLNNKQFNDYVKEGPLTEFFTPPATVFTPHVLKDGSDSVGALGALNRVFINIGLFSEEWLLHFNPLVGGKDITPMEIAVARKNSAYWQVTEAQTPDLALFFLKTTDPHKLKDAPGGEAYLTADAEVLARGKQVFAETCARCHSSKLPELAPEVSPANCAGPDYLACFSRYWDHTKTPEFKEKMREIVDAEDFLDNNFLSTDLRIPVSLLETNACSPLASNAIGGNIWDNFSSQSYKDLPSVGTIKVHDPITGEEKDYPMPADGRGYTRPASLISLWSSAPFLLNNTVGKFEWSPSVEARMRSFDDSIEQMLWPEKRDKDSVLGGKVPGLIDRTSEESYLRVPVGFLPGELKPLLGPLATFLPAIFGADGVEIGPIPKGTPINLLSNLDLRGEGGNFVERIAHRKEVAELLIGLKRALKALPKEASDPEKRKVLAEFGGKLLAFNKCPDFVVNRGHYFGTSFSKDEPGLSDSDKQALIGFLKTF